MDTTEDVKKLIERAEGGTLIDVVLEHWLGKEIDTRFKKILEQIMILSFDHSAQAPSAKATIAAALGGKDLIRSVEAGIGEINESHGGAVEGLGKILSQDKRSAKEIVNWALNSGVKLPGYGHRIYKTVDPRAQFILKSLSEAGLHGEISKKALEIESELEIQKHQKLVLNIDGAIAVALTEMQIDPGLMNAFFLWPRVAGLIYRWKTV